MKTIVMHILPVILPEEDVFLYPSLQQDLAVVGVVVRDHVPWG